MNPILTTLLALGLCAGPANAATYYLDSGIWFDDNGTSAWDDVKGTGGTNPSALPTAGNTDTWVVHNNRGQLKNSSTWYGGTTRIDATNSTTFASFLAWESRTLQDVFLNGGALTTNNNTIAGNALTVATSNGSDAILSNEGAATGTFDFNSISGFSDIRILSVNNGAIASFEWKALIAAGTDLSGYTGTFLVLDDSELEFGGDVLAASFGLEVGAAQGGGIEATYSLRNNVSVTSANLGGTALTSGTYTGSDLNTLGLGAFITDNGGTLTVIPEPASLALFGLGGLLMIARRRRS